ncbi:MAG TPA: SUMF1/EgtB/PvdO family nonheme iron enzyme, partial [Polyangiaceae bacterium]|nr:SUMF1/EgtB/PvdO family nonheme iron enzyme [Polyangiaceae bacterium]
CYYPSGSGVCGYDVSNIAPVGTAVRGAGRWGQLDLAGNLWQWILDYYTRPHLLPYPGYACTDCATNTCEVYCYSNRTVREVQGGDYADRVWTPLDPFAFENTTRLCQVGFRCARTP